MLSGQTDDHSPARPVLQATVLPFEVQGQRRLDIRLPCLDPSSLQDTDVNNVNNEFRPPEANPEVPRALLVRERHWGGVGMVGEPESPGLSRQMPTAFMLSPV